MRMIKHQHGVVQTIQYHKTDLQRCNNPDPECRCHVPERLRHEQVYAKSGDESKDITIGSFHQKPACTRKNTPCNEDLKLDIVPEKKHK